MSINQHAKVRFGADTSGFRRRLQEMTGLSRQQVNLLMSVFAGFSIRGVYRQFSQLIDRLDEIGKSARALGIGTDEFQHLEFASKRTGGSMRQTETALNRMARTIGDSARGTARATEALSELGLAYEDLIDLNLVSQFELIGDRINRVENQQQRLNLAQEFFGRSGKVVLDMAANYDELARAAESTIIGEDHIQAAEDYKDAMQDLGRVIQHSIVESGFLPWLTDLIDQWRYIIAGVETAEQMYDQSVSNMIRNTQRLADEGVEIDARPLRAQVSTIEKDMQSMRDRFREINEEIAEAEKLHSLGIPTSARELREERRQLSERTRSLAENLRQMRYLIDNQDELNQKAREAAEARKAEAAEQAEIARLEAERLEKQKEAERLQEQHEEAVNRAASRLETSARSQELLNQGLETEAQLVAVIGDRYAQLSEKERDRLTALVERLQAARDAAEGMQETIRSSEKLRATAGQFERIRRIGGGFAETGASQVNEQTRIAKQQLSRLHSIERNTQMMARNQIDLEYR